MIFSKKLLFYLVILSAPLNYIRPHYGKKRIVPAGIDRGNTVVCLSVLNSAKNLLIILILPKSILSYFEKSESVKSVLEYVSVVMSVLESVLVYTPSLAGRACFSPDI